MAEQRRSGVQSVARAIAILHSFSLERPERSVTELSQDLLLHKSTVSRLMATLERGGLLSRDPGSHRYRLGIGLLALAAQVANHADLRETARPVLRRLADECEESVNLSVLDRPPRGSDLRIQVFNLEQFVAPTRRVKNIGWVGRRMAPHATSAGKTLLACLSPRELESLLPPEMERFTANTIVERSRFQQELQRVRDRGYATVEQELEEGLNAVSVPVHDHRGTVVAAISVAGPAYRVSPGVFSQLADLLQQAAAEISRGLGYRPVAGERS